MFNINESRLLSKLLTLGVLECRGTHCRYKPEGWNLIEEMDGDNWGLWDSDKGMWVDAKSLEHIEQMARKMIERKEPWP